MTPDQLASGMYQERAALLDRIQLYESSAKYGSEDWRVSMVGALDSHIAHAKARLERIDDRIASLRSAAHV